MQETLADGQDAMRLALRLLGRAARALVEEGRLSTEGLLPSYRSIAPREHAHAGADVLDVAFIARCRALGGDALLAAPTLLVHAAPPRARARVAAAAGDHACGDALALALGLSLEAAKLAHGLGAPAELLRATFATPVDAKRALDALARGGAAREVDATAFIDAAPSRVNAAALTALANDRAVYVVVGAGGRRVLDLLSPFARVMRTELAALGAGHGGNRADDVYAGIAGLCAADDGVDVERHAAEAGEGLVALGPGASALRCELLVEAHVDGRVREAASSFKRARALIVIVEERGSSLSAALDAIGDACRGVIVVVEATGESTPAFVSEIASGHLAPIDNALASPGEPTSSTLTLPSLALCSTATPGVVDDVVFPLVQATLRARAHGVLATTARLGLKTVRAGDVASLSLCCIDLLGRLGPSQREDPRKGPRGPRR